MMQDAGSGQKPYRSQGLIDWLKKREFSADPFEYTNAEFEEEVLPRYYVDQGNLDILLESRKPVIIFAAKGSGKTAQRQMLASMCRPSDPRSRLFALNYTYEHFERTLQLAGGQIEQVKTAHHVEAILCAGVAGLAESLDTGSFSADALDPIDSPGLWQAYLARYAPERIDPRSAAAAESQIARQTPAQLVRGFAGLLVRAGFQRGLVFVDGLDEFPATAGRQGQAVGFLAELLGVLPILETRGLAFRFFLTADLEPELARQDWYRADRLEIAHILWNAAQLAGMVQQRLTYFSRGRKPPYEDLAQLCDPDLAARINAELYPAGGMQPRGVLQKASDLFRQHALQPEPPDRISLAAWERVYPQAAAPRTALEVQAPSTQADPAEIAAPPQSPATGAPLLRVEKEKVQVWLGEKDIRIKLTNQDYKTLVCLYDHKDNLCSYNTLAATAWGQTVEPTLIDNETIAAAITRIRRVLKNHGDGWNYIETRRGDRLTGGYRLVPTGLDKKEPSPDNEKTGGKKKT